jgi:hypothetical protein
MKIVFVHLGNAPAEHLWANIKFLLARFATIQIVLVSDLDRKEFKSHPRVEWYKYIRPSDHLELFSALEFDLDFRSGFWQFTLERIFAIEQYQRSAPDSRVLHIESDVLLLDAFPFDLFSKLEKMCWLQVDENRDVATIIYSPSWEFTKLLSASIPEYLRVDPELTDMKFLRRFRLDNPELVVVGPSLSAGLASELNSLGKISVEKANELSVLSEYFGGIFDPAAIGMWLTGSDPRNYYGFKKMFDTREILKGGTHFDPSLFEYTMNNSGELSISMNQFESRVWCLHIHSKDIRFFSDTSQSQIRELVDISGSGKIHTEFSFSCLQALLRENIKKGTIIGFVLFIPQLKPLRNSLLNIRSIIRRARGSV